MLEEKTRKNRGKRARLEILNEEENKEEAVVKEHVQEKRRKSEPVVTTPTPAPEKKIPEVPIPTDRPVRVYADGIYDLFHFGHARSLEQAKKLFPNTHLIVGVCNDKLTHSLKGKTVMNDRERAESLRHCKWVDEVVENAPWLVTQPFMDEHQIDFVAHGEDIILDDNGEDIYKFVKDKGRYKTIKRTEGISTSDIILRIVKDYDDYVLRNLARGYTGKQMNVGYMKEKQIKMEDKIKKIRNKVKESVDRWSQEKHIANFMKSFGVRMERLVSPFKFHSESEDSPSEDGADSDRSSSPASP